MNGELRQRSTVGRVAIPVDSPRPLVPADVWASWQRKLQQAKAPEPLAPVLDGAPVAMPDEDRPAGLGATTRADVEVALFALGQVPPFGGASPKTLEALAHGARQGELGPGDVLFHEGAPADSFYVVLDGALEVLQHAGGREVALRQLERSEPVGLFGVLSGQRRATCVRAIGEAILLEVSATDLTRTIAQDDGLRRSVAAFFRERLVEGFVETSPLFTDVEALVRARVIGRFAAHTLRAGDTLVRPGEVTHLLAVVLGGRLLIESPSKLGGGPERFDLIPGELLALTSAFSGAPCRMRVYAAEPTTLALLGHRALAELLRDHASLRSITARLPEVARALDRDVWCGHCAVPGL